MSVEKIFMRSKIRGRCGYRHGVHTYQDYTCGQFFGAGAPVVWFKGLDMVACRSCWDKAHPENPWVDPGERTTVVLNIRWSRHLTGISRVGVPDWMDPGAIRSLIADLEAVAVCREGRKPVGQEAASGTLLGADNI